MSTFVMLALVLHVIECLTLAEMMHRHIQASNRSIRLEPLVPHKSKSLQLRVVSALLRVLSVE
jgi:hypothetical protein